MLKTLQLVPKTSQMDGFRTHISHIHTEMQIYMNKQKRKYLQFVERMVQIVIMCWLNSKKITFWKVTNESIIGHCQG